MPQRQDYPAVNCPKCQRMLPADGEMLIGELAIAIYCCPECVTRKSVMGEKMELPLMFILAPDGNPCDPADPDWKIDLTEYD